MPTFITPVDIPPPPRKTGYHMKHVFIGSCFTESIGVKMEELKFKTDINPFGILYNPVSISKAVSRLVSASSFGIDELTFHAGLWHSFSHHGRFSDEIPEATLQKINDRIRTSSSFLKIADFLILTFGSAWVYALKSSGEIVANCHKVPASEFHRFRLSVNEIVTSIGNMLGELRTFNPGIRIILTVSPVRHALDGAIENQRSKASLLLAIDAVLKDFGREKCYYFPAYELMMDELRDYRFYGEDMFHPSSLAVDFIWEKFMRSFVAEESIEIINEITPVLKAMDHRPVLKNSPEYRIFIENSLRKTLLLAKKHPELDFSTEIEYFSNKF